jgi:hypothetical protein
MHQTIALLMGATPVVLSITACMRLRARMCLVVCCLAPWRRVWWRCAASSWVADI